MINNNKIILIRNYILSEMNKMSSRIRVADEEIEVESKKRDSSASDFRFKVIKTTGEKTLMRVIYSAYEADGRCIVRSSDQELPTEEVNELFYAVSNH